MVTIAVKRYVQHRETRYFRMGWVKIIPQQSSAAPSEQSRIASLQRFGISIPAAGSGIVTRQPTGRLGGLKGVKVRPQIA